MRTFNDLPTASAPSVRQNGSLDDYSVFVQRKYGRNNSISKSYISAVQEHYSNLGGSFVAVPAKQFQQPDGQLFTGGETAPEAPRKPKAFTFDDQEYAAPRASPEPLSESSSMHSLMGGTPRDLAREHQLLAAVQQRDRELHNSRSHQLDLERQLYEAKFQLKEQAELLDQLVDTDEEDDDEGDEEIELCACAPDCIQDDIVTDDDDSMPPAPAPLVREQTRF